MSNSETWPSVERRKGESFSLTRWIKILAAIQIFFVVASAAALVFQASFTNTSYAPLGNYPVQKVLNRLPAYGDRPALYMGDDIIVSATKCNVLSVPVAVQGIVNIVRRDPNSAHEYYLLNTGNGIRNVGCENFNYRNKMPAEVTPGVWRLEGQETARDGSYVQTRVYLSEDFIVVARLK